MALKQIKSKIKSVEKTRKVTKAMEAVSAAKMRKAQQQALSGRAYARAATSILARVSGSQQLKNHPLTRGSEASRSPASGHNGNASERNTSSRSLYIVITSDKGLAGGLNSAVLRSTLADIKGEAEIIAVGKKANEFFINRGFKVLAFHPNTDAVNAEIVMQLVQESAEKFASGDIDVVKIAYQNFVSTFEQRPTMRTIFPLSIEELEKVVGDITPAKGAFAKTEGEVRPQAYTIEPGEEEVLGEVLPRLASIFVYHALLESLASEHSARMVAMKSASDKAGELTHSLTLVFNKVRQAAITREVSEITGGIEAMS